MCGANGRFLLYLLLALLFVSVAGALRGEEREPWYLISETELRSIELYRERSEAEKRGWLLQAQELKAQADGLRQDSESLNSQLLAARERNRSLERLYSESEAAWLTRLSSKNGEIAGLERAAAERALETEKYKGAARGRLIIIAALAGAWAVFIAFRIYRFFRAGK